MDLIRLREILAAFADDPSSVIVEKGRIVAQIQSELITATSAIREGMLYVVEDGETFPAPRWVANRIAQLDLIADRIINLFPDNPKFVVPSGLLLDQIEESPQDEAQPVEDTVRTASSFLGRRPGGVCSVLYLTSDAGEGKTTVINHLAHRQAVAYRQRKTDWLLLPFNLGGNAFLRLDNVIAAGLLNQLRIRRFYMDGFYHLVRLGYIIPALDGFEEVFVETSSEAVSSLGSMIRDIRGEGTLMVAARTAYFEFKRMDRQARLFDTIPNLEVGFGRLSLNRWKRKQFIEYCKLNNVTDPEPLYEDLAARLGPEHALLTRAFFVSRIADIASTVEGVRFLQEVQPRVQDSFRPFIDQILDREVQLKWIDKHSQPAEPLLTPAEHHELLRLLAEEMWMSKRGSLPRSTTEDLADLYCDMRKKSPTVTRQVRERLSNHALLVAEAAGTQLAFDHDHFREFFLGEQLGEYIRQGASAEVRKILRLDSVPGWTLDSAIALALRSGASPAGLLKTVMETVATEGPTSFVRENGGSLCLRIAEKLPDGVGSWCIEDITMPQDALSGRVLKNLTFANCYFRSTVIRGSLTRITFEDCEFEHLEVEDEFSFATVAFSDCQIHGLTVSREEESTTDFYDPEIITAYLARSGATFARNSQQVLVTGEVPEDDEGTKVVKKLLVIFKRTTRVSDSIIAKRLGVLASLFFGSLCAELLETAVLKPVKNRGGGNQLRFRLGRSMSAIADALADARGSYETFVHQMKATAQATSDDEGDEGEHSPKA